MLLRVASTFALACIALTANSAVRAEPRAVIELFTSQGCSSCPAADKLAGELARDPNNIVLSLAVDYWDYLGWKDTLAISGHSNRQRAYAKSRGDREVYTPQVVVNGAKHVLGSDKAAIEKAIVQTHQNPAALALPVTMAVAGDKLTVNVAAKDGTTTQAEVWLCPVTKAVQVAIGRGENDGRTITYTNVVKRWVKLGDWNGKAETFNVPLADLQSGDIDSVVVLVQSGAASAPKTMLGASQVALK
jgi:hypothetical protein